MVTTLNSCGLGRIANLAFEILHNDRLWLNLMPEWISAVATAATALFTGLLLWREYRRTRPVFELRFENANEHLIGLAWIIYNRSERTTNIEKLSCDPPFGIVVDEDGRMIGLFPNHPSITMPRKILHSV